MAKNLVIVESPAKAKTIKKILGKDFEVKASAGHIRDLPKKGIGVNIKKNFEPQYEVLEEKADVVKDLQEAAGKAKVVYLAPDPDREGEAIAWHLANILGEGITFKRIEFNEITKEAIQRAIKHPRDIDVKRVDAQQARRVLDRLVGYKISPLLWQKVRRGLSAGRVQSVSVRLIVDREKEILAFTPQEYWSIAAEMTKGAAKTGAFMAELNKWKAKKLDITNEKTATEIVTSLKTSEYKVQKIGTKEQKRQPGPPFITSTLQQEASRRFGFTVKRTMTLAQQLYEGVDLGEEGPVGLITYMRTDSTRVAKEAQEEAVQFVTEKWGKPYLPDAPRVFKSKKGAQDAHEAIRPTSVYRTPDQMKKHLTPDQNKLYKLVWERFMASQMANALLSVLTVEINAGDGLFRVSDTKVVFAGYQALYTELSENEGEEEEKNSKLPDLKEGDVLKLKEVHPKQHFTQPPPRFTEASLVKALEEQGIGRPSTYAPTISTVQQRGYVQKEGRALQPTELGVQVNDQLVAHFPNIVDTKFTADMEEKLDNVEAGGEAWQDLIGTFYKPFAETLKLAAKEMKPVEIPSGEMCEVCGAEYLIKSGRFGEFLACSKYPECKSTKPIIRKVGMKCPTCNEGDVIIKKSRTGKTFYGCERWSKDETGCSFTSWDQPTEIKCVKCQTMMVLKRSKAGRNFLLCTNAECKHIANVPRKKADGKEDNDNDQEEGVENEAPEAAGA
jgi:DNA topoisomerase-1